MNDDKVTSLDAFRKRREAEQAHEDEDDECSLEELLILPDVRVFASIIEREDGGLALVTVEFEEDEALETSVDVRDLEHAFEEIRKLDWSPR